MLLQAVNFAYTYMNKTFLRGGTCGNDSPLWGEKVKNSPSPAQQQQQPDSLSNQILWFYYKIKVFD